VVLFMRLSLLPGKARSAHLIGPRAGQHAGGREKSLVPAGNQSLVLALKEELHESQHSARRRITNSRGGAESFLRS
jgi:hypothetical protein